MNKKIEHITVGDIQTNCWLYPLDEEPAGFVKAKSRSCVVIDPGDEANLIISRLKELDWVPRYIFLTHGHIDHLAALPDLLAFYGTDTGSPPRIGVHRLDARYLGKDSLAIHRDSFTAAGGNAVYVNAHWKPMPNGDLFFEEGDTAGPFKVLYLPGHTQGSIGLYDEKAGILFSGDTLFKGTWGRTDLPGGDEDSIHRSLKRLLSMKGEIVVYPGHGPVTTIRDEAGLLMEL